MFEKLVEIERRFVAIEDSLLEPQLTSTELTRLSKERAELEDIVTQFREHKKIEAALVDAREMLTSEDEEMRQLAKEEIDPLTKGLEEAKQNLITLMLPKDPKDQKNVILEIRAGTGGDEAGLFCGDLLRMYSKYAESKHWKMEMMNAMDASRGGFKEVVLLITGKQVYSKLKFESGVHRVQRVPETEAQGRVHTSACTVAVLPEAEEVEIAINPADLRVDTYRSSGAGGQHVNTTDSAVRITHIPTGVISESQEERSQHKNREKAMKMLRSRLLEKFQKEQDDAISQSRKSQVGSGDRSEKIRTYNFPQGRLTDHRINLTLYKLSDIMNGDLDAIFDALGAHHTAEMLRTQ